MTKVTISTETVGQAFGTRGVVRSAKTGRVLATTETKPYGFTTAAVEAAREICIAHDYAWQEIEDRGYAGE